MVSEFFNLKKRSVKEILSLLYRVGIIPILYKAYLFGYYIYLNNTYDKDFWFVENGQRLSSSKIVNNAPLAIIGGIIFIIVSIFAWKLVCELLLIMFQYFEAKNK
jgi:hypothetical protein